MADPVLPPQPDGEVGGPERAYREGYRSGFGDGFAQAKQAARDDANDKAPDTGPKEGESTHERAQEKDRAGQPSDHDKDKHKDGPPKGPPIWKRPVPVLIGIVVVIALIIAALLFWRHSSKHATTDDAFIDGQASRIAAQAAGRVIKLTVADNQEVQAGDPLIEIDSSDVQARVDAAKAQVATAESQAEQARAQIENARASAVQADATTRQSQAEATRAAQDLVRFQNVDPDAVARRQADSALADSRAAQARLEGARSATRSSAAQIHAAEAQLRIAEAGIAAARANEEAAELQLSYTHVVAPIAGRVTRRAVDVGNVISIGQPLLAIVSHDLWVTANYKETQLTDMRVGQHVSITVDAFPNVAFDAHVDSIQRGTGAYFSMLPAENATGNYVKVVQRVPVKIVFDRPDDLRRYAIGPGMSVTPDVTLH